MIKDTKKIIATISLSVAVFAASAITLEEAKTLYIKGKYEEAFKRYKRYAEGRKEEFSLSMQEIMPTLITLGADEENIQLIIDAILQNWSSL